LAPADWAAGERRPGVWLLPDLSARTAQEVAGRIAAQRRAGDRVVFSVHWGGNWGYDVPDSQRAFAHALIDAGAADLVHGHSSHHPKGIEVYRDRPILYGCGDFLNDYEGIGGHGGYRSDLVVMYLARLRAADGVLAGLTLVPLRIRRFRLERASAEDAAWLCGKLDTQSRPFGAGVADDGACALALRWG
jgi:poly-gamma-glutamate capsule biosynthesis protein CapA/YwtB (metallophosphatase superfamily)